MIFKLVLGVDISKKWFNFCLMNQQFEILEEGEVDNTPDEIFKFISQLLNSNLINSLDEVLLCMEHTGIYIQHLTHCWLQKQGRLTVVDAMKVSEHLAGRFGFEEKTDKIDARRLAEYAFRYSDKLKLWKTPNHTIVALKRFQRQRERLIIAINSLEVPLKESRSFDSIAICEKLHQNQQASVNALKTDLENLEKSINELIESDEELRHLFKLIKSVEGVGPVTAREFIIATEGFTKFTPKQAKSFSKYSGVIPVRKKMSGTSVKSKAKIPKRKHKKIKGLLTMGAHSLVGSKQELGKYYERKMQEGKHHLAVINAMRNKMILRVFAVVRNQSIYLNNLNVSLD